MHAGGVAELVRGGLAQGGQREQHPRVVHGQVVAFGEVSEEGAADKVGQLEQPLQQTRIGAASRLSRHRDR